MKMKPLWKVSVTTTLEAEDAVAELLGTIFHGLASAYFDVEKRTSIVSIFCPGKIRREARPEVVAGLKRIRKCGLDLGPGRLSIGRVRRQDWAESWKRHFKPIVIGNALLIKPSWNKRLPRRGQALVVLDPGLSFGTGQHPTTSFCLRQIVKSRVAAARRIHPSFLDIGTGSGILAIAAAKLGYRPVEAFDFDGDVVRIAKANAFANRVRIRVYRGDVTRRPARPAARYDLVCANLISNLLIAERKKIASRVTPGGVLVLAGILKSEFSTVRRAYETLGLRMVSTRTEKEWQSGSFSFA